MGHMDIHWVHKDIKMGRADTGYYCRGQRKETGKARTEKVPIGYYAHYLGDGIVHTPNLSISRYTHVTNLHMDSLNLK